MMLDHLGQTDAVKCIIRAIEQSVYDKVVMTPDLKGGGNTDTAGDAVAKLLL